MAVIGNQTKEDLQSALLKSKKDLQDLAKRMDNKSNYEQALKDAMEVAKKLEVYKYIMVEMTHILDRWFYDHNVPLETTTFSQCKESFACIYCNTAQTQKDNVKYWEMRRCTSCNTVQGCNGCQGCNSCQSCNSGCQNTFREGYSPTCAKSYSCQACYSCQDCYAFNSSCPDCYSSCQASFTPCSSCQASFTPCYTCYSGCEGAYSSCPDCYSSCQASFTSCISCQASYSVGGFVTCTSGYF